jgi:hypothetical protein
VWQIPTILAYRGETLAACGAEAREFIGDDEYKIAKWFKARNIMSLSWVLIHHVASSASRIHEDIK